MSFFTAPRNIILCPISFFYKTKPRALRTLFFQIPEFLTQGLSSSQYSYRNESALPPVSAALLELMLGVAVFLVYSSLTETTSFHIGVLEEQNRVNTGEGLQWYADQTEAKFYGPVINYAC